MTKIRVKGNHFGTAKGAEGVSATVVVGAVWGGVLAVFLFDIFDENGCDGLILK